MNHTRVAPLCAGLLALTVAAYFPVWGNDFVNLDDPPYITDNPHVTGGMTGSGFCWAWANDEAPYWLPITWLSLEFDAQFFSTRGPRGEVALCPAAFHGDNLFWHAAGALLLFGLWHRLTGARWRSFLVGALFAVHPMHVESVAWAAERKDVLSGFFGALTLWAYVRYLENPGLRRYLGLAAAFLLSLLSKPMLLTLPCVLLLLDYWPLRRWGPAPPPGPAGPDPKRVPFGRLVREKVPLFGLAAVIAVVTMEARLEHGALVPLDVLPLSARLANASTAYGWYLSSTFCPVRLAALYPHPYGEWSPGPALAGAGVLLSVTALSWWQASRRPWLLTGWLWFAAALVPVLGLAQGGAQAWADRFSYWPHVGLFAALAWGLGELAGRVRLPRWACGAVGAVVLGGLAALTWAQLAYWRNSVTLWERAVAVTQDNDRAHLYLSLSYRERGRLREAELHLLEALRIQAKRRARPAR